MTQEEIEAIVIAEFRYWSGPEVPGEIGITGSGAAANIYAAIKGFRAPWHPQKPLPPQPPKPLPPQPPAPSCGLCNGEKVYWKNNGDGSPLVETPCPYCATNETPILGT